MSLLQWVKSGFGLGQRRTSETTPPSLETSDTFGEGPDLLVPREDYGELFAAPEEYRDTAFAAAVQMYARVTSAGYDIQSVTLRTIYVTDSQSPPGSLGGPVRSEVEITVASRRGGHPARISIKV